MTETLLYVGLILVCAIGVGATVLRLPGTWLIALAAVGYSWHGQWKQPNATILGIIIGLAVSAEIIEFMASAVAAKRAGATSRAGWCALIGGFAGMILFTIPLPIIGTIIGGALGCFAGAVIGELTVHDNVARGARVGLFAAVGMVMGTVAKIMIAALMAGTAITAAAWG